MGVKERENSGQRVGVGGWRHDTVPVKVKRMCFLWGNQEVMDSGSEVLIPCFEKRVGSGGWGIYMHFWNPCWLFFSKC